MAIVSLSPHLHRCAAAQAGTAFPLAIAGLAVLPSVLDLLGALQRLPVLAPLAGIVCVAATVALLAQLAHGVRSIWLLAAALAFGLSGLLRVGELGAGPLFAMLGVLALGLSGAFRGEANAPVLLDSPRQSDAGKVITLPTPSDEPASEQLPQAA